MFYFSIEDHGQWTCFLTDDAILGADKATINIEVGVPAKVRFDPGYGDVGILRITEGETTKVKKEARNLSDLSSLDR